MYAELSSLGNSDVRVVFSGKAKRYIECWAAPSLHARPCSSCTPSHCLPACRASHRASMVLSRLLVATPYNGSITVRTPAPCDHPSAFVRYRLPRAPETCTPFTRGCMTSEPHSTRFERAPGAFSDFTWCSGLGGRTVWRVMMAHSQYGSAKRSVRAVWADFGATVAGHSGR